MTRPVRQETLLVVEDDASLRLSLTLTLRAEGFKVVTAATGPEGLERAQNGGPDAVILDVMLPGMNGFEVCERIRASNTDMPVLLVTAKGELEDRVRGLGLGADDYIVKPFGAAELVARVHAALRRRRIVERTTTSVEFSDVVVDFASHRVTKGGVEVECTALELKLLRYFFSSEGRLLTRQQILDAVWGSDYFGTERTVDNFINRLRTKLEDDPKNAVHFATVRGAGYRFSREKKR